MHLRLAARSDAPALTRLIEASIRDLGAQVYDEREIESSLRHLFGVDTRLIDDGTYFVVEYAGRIVGAGGWSRRRTPFGGDQAEAVRDEGRRDPRRDPAVIRAFYVHPDQARRGIGRRLLEACERAARTEGFTRFELVATLSGAAFYQAAGYRAVEPVAIPMPDGPVIRAVRMEKPPPSASHPIP